MKIIVDTFKSSGKWNTTYELFLSDAIFQTYDSDSIQQEIEYRYPNLREANYVYEASFKNTINKRLVIND